MSAVLRARAPYQRLSGPALASPEAVVGHFGCMQSQDFGKAKWAIGRRADGLTEADIDAAFSTGTFLRTHVLRPTWHFVLPEDLGWTMSITAPRVHRLMATFNKTIDLTEAEMDKGAEIIVAALTGSGGPLTRAQLAEHLSESGIRASGPRLAHIAMHAELLALTCNGPMAGTDHTYVLAPESATWAPHLSEDEALARLATTYVRGHGPSRPADLAWWSSLTLTQSRRAFELAGLRPIKIDGIDLWIGDEVLEEQPLPRAALMPPFDESISYADKPIDAARFPGKAPDLARGGGLLFIDGLISGTWSRRIKAQSVAITVTAVGPVNRLATKAIQEEAERYGAFVGLASQVQITA